MLARAADMMNFVQSTMNLDDYSERNYGVAHPCTDTREKNNARTSIQVCSCTRSQVAARLVLNLNFTVLSLLLEDDDALDPFKLEV